MSCFSRLLTAVALVAFSFGAFAADDAATRSAIAKSLVQKLGDGAKPIAVAYADGKAMLTGRVESRAVQELAEEVALAVPGVKSVENDIEAAKERGIAQGKLMDEGGDMALESSVKTRLGEEIGKYAADVGVEACDGWVSIRGTLDATRKKLAIDAVSSMKDVKKLIDLISVP
jgi:osmotically-inducible protein OsmY